MALTLTWRTELTWRAGPTRMRCGTEATWQGRAWPTRGAGGAERWQEATWVHADTREGRHVASGEVGRWRAQELVGLGYRIGAVTHALRRPTLYTRKLHLFSPCETMFPRSLILQVTWTNCRRWL